MLKKLTCTFFAFWLSYACYAKNFVIFNISQDFPMGEEDEILLKNFYVNIGTDQGVHEGTLLDIFRIISKNNPYAGAKRISMKIKIGELEIIHSEENYSIAVLSQRSNRNQFFLDINAVMIGDQVNVKIVD
jgi:hypothetical protein